jgi:hypothetical protein
LIGAVLALGSLQASATTQTLFSKDFTWSFDTNFHQAFLDPFTISVPGTITATLNDFGFFTDFQVLGMAVVKSGGPSFGQILAPGSFSFNVGAGDLGEYKVLLAWQAGSPASGGSVNVVGPIPEPEIWALMLVGTGLVGFQLRRKRKAAEANRLALS